VFVNIDAPLLHRSLSSLLKRIIAPRIRRFAAVPANALQDTIDNAADGTARIVLLSMFSHARYQLEGIGEPDLANQIYGSRPLHVSQRLPQFLNALIETFGIYSVRTNHHEHAQYIATVPGNIDNFFNIPAGNVRNLSELQNQILKIKPP